MKLIVNGDSNTYGLELCPSEYRWTRAANYYVPSPDETETKVIDAYREQRSYGGLIGKALRASETINISRCGASNDRIVRTMLEWLGVNLADVQKCPEEFLVIIGWTSPDRVEFRDDDNDDWLNGMPMDRKFESYYRDYHSDHNSVVRFWQQVVFMQNLLERYSVRHYSFLCYDDPILTSEVEYFRDLINWDQIEKTPMYSFLDGYSQGEGLHFLEDGHAAWATHLLKGMKCA